MTLKQLDAGLSEWLFKFFMAPLLMVAPYLRTNYWLQGDIFTFKRPFRRPVSLSIGEFDEIGVETTDQGPFVEDVFWILKRGDVRLRIGDPHPVFKMLMDRFDSLEGFDWRLFAEAMSCTDNRYFLCWRHHPPPNKSLPPTTGLLCISTAIMVAVFMAGCSTSPSKPAKFSPTLATATTNAAMESPKLVVSCID